VIGEVGGGPGHMAAVAERADATALARERDDKPLAAARAEGTAEPEAEDAALEIAAEFLLDVARRSPLGGFSPLEPVLEVGCRGGRLTRCPGAGTSSRTKLAEGSCLALAH